MGISRFSRAVCAVHFVLSYRHSNSQKKQLAATLKAIADVTGRVAGAEWAAVERVLWVCAAALSNDVRLVTRLETRLNEQHEINDENIETLMIELLSKPDLKYVSPQQMNRT